MSEKMTSEAVDRESGYLYYLGKDGFVWKTPMRSNKSGRKEKVGREKVEREEGYLYFIDKEGYVSRTKQGRRSK